MTNGEEVELRVRKAAANAINASGDDLAGRAIEEAPVLTGELRASARFPGNDPDARAYETDLEASVSFNTPYAAAQHEGFAEQHRQYAVVPIVKSGVVVGFFTDKTKLKPHTVQWVVKNHPGGGKTHYLSDPLKAMVDRYQAVIAASVKKSLEE